jgi:hypothetical protein
MRCQRTCKITILSWRFCEVRWINVGFENIYHIKTSRAHVIAWWVFSSNEYIQVNGDRALNLTVYLFITRQGLIVTAVLEAVSKVLIGNFYFTIIGSLVHNLCHHSSPRLAFPHFASQIFQPLFFRRIYKILKWQLIRLIKRILW